MSIAHVDADETIWAACAKFLCSAQTSPPQDAHHPLLFPPARRPALQRAAESAPVQGTRASARPARLQTLVSFGAPLGQSRASQRQRISSYSTAHSAGSARLPAAPSTLLLTSIAYGENRVRLPAPPSGFAIAISQTRRSLLGAELSVSRTGTPATEAREFSRGLPRRCIPTRSRPELWGQVDSQDLSSDAHAGPNTCSPQVPCTIQYDLCASGLVKPRSGYIWACRSDRPSNAVLNVRTSLSGRCKGLRWLVAGGLGNPCHLAFPPKPLSSAPALPGWPQGFGAWCFDSLQKCNLGAPRAPSTPGPPLPPRPSLCPPREPPSSQSLPLRLSRHRRLLTPAPRPAANNPCSEQVPCVLAPSYCSTGVAGDYAGAYNYFCNYSAPPPELATPNGAGQLCYATMEACMSGGNACDESNPCGAHPSTCFTGVVRAPARPPLLPATDPSPPVRPRGGWRISFPGLI